MNFRRQSYTSYYANCIDLAKAGVVPISISLYSPRGWHDLEYKKLAPTFDILLGYKHDNNEARYAERYKLEILDGLDPHEVMNELIHMVGKSHEFALVCYERPVSFCHHHLVADWLNKHGYPCEEFPSKLYGRQSRVILVDEL